MKLLFISPYAPTPIRTRPYHFLKFLAARGLDITLATLLEHPDELAALEELRDLGIRVSARSTRRARVFAGAVRALLAGEPFQARYSWNPLLAAEISSLLVELTPDVVHVEHLRGAAYARWIRQHFPNIPIVWDSVDSISHLFAQAARASASTFGRLVSRLELRRTRRYEGRMVQAVSHVTVTSEDDRQALLALAPDVSPGRVSVVTNGVDLGKFFPIDGPVQQDTILFTGKMSYHANVTAAVQFVRDVMPLIWQQRPAVQLQIVGKGPTRQVRRLGADRRVRVVGEVAELRPYLGAAAVAVAPIAYGAGVQNKVLEAMACRTAVVASPAAVSALQLDDANPPLLIAGSAQAFADAVLQLLADPADRAVYAQSGFEYVQRHHRWSDSAAKLESIYHESIQPIS